MNKKVKVKLSTVISMILLVGLIVYLSLTFTVRNKRVYEYYQVYLGGEKIGVIASADELYNMIDEEQKDIKEKYGVDKIYPPSGLELKKIKTYNKNADSTKKIYEEIKDLDPFTIEGYQVNVRNKETNKYKTFHILKKEDLDKAIQNTVTSFLSEEEYNKYLEGKQEKVIDEGKEITDIYFGEDVTIKKTYISAEEDIITNEEDLSMYFLFGTTKLDKKYVVKESDTIETIAYNNELGVSDFLTANPNIVSENALLAIGQEVTVAPINPVASIVVESFDTSYQDIGFETKVEYDKTLSADQMFVKQEGMKGRSKVTYATKYMNGVIIDTAFVSDEVISEPVDKIVVYGGQNITYYGNTTYWAWPTSKPFRISSYYGYRIHPVYHDARFHNGIDITGTKSDNIYSIQSGTVTVVSYSSSMGYYIRIKHGNGYESMYLHLRKQLVSVGDKVEKGELIGLMGSTGVSTGKHLDLNVLKDGSRINPLSLYQ